MYKLHLRKLTIFNYFLYFLPKLTILLFMASFEDQQ